MKDLTQKLLNFAKWLVKHVTVSSRDLNAIQPHERDDNRKPKSAVEVKLKWDF